MPNRFSWGSVHIANVHFQDVSNVWSHQPRFVSQMSKYLTSGLRNILPTYVYVFVTSTDGGSSEVGQSCGPEFWGTMRRAGLLLFDFCTWYYWCDYGFSPRHWNDKKKCYQGRDQKTDAAWLLRRLLFWGGSRLRNHPSAARRSHILACDYPSEVRWCWLVEGRLYPAAFRFEIPTIRIGDSLLLSSKFFRIFSPSSTYLWQNISVRETKLNCALQRDLPLDSRLRNEKFGSILIPGQIFWWTFDGLRTFTSKSHL